MNPNRYAALSSEEFETRVRAIAARMGVAWVLSLPGVYEIVSEELNNAVLEEWERDNPRPTARWCFTQWELASPDRIAACRATDEFIANSGDDLGVIVYRDGRVSNRWEDGTRGLSSEAEQFADLDESPTKPLHAQCDKGEGDDHYADAWRDVEINSDGSPTLV